MKKREFTSEQKTKMVLEVLREDRTVNEIAGEYGVHPTQLQLWKAEALEKMPQLFSKESTEAEKLKKQHQQEKEELNQEIGQLFMKVYLMQSHGVRISMDNKGRACDNARTERFFRSLKYDKLYINKYASVRIIRQAIGEYIEDYNRERPYQALDYEVPVTVYQGAA